MKFRRPKHPEVSTTPNHLNIQEVAPSAELAIAKLYTDACDPFVVAAWPRFKDANARDAHDAFLEAFCTAARVRYTSFALTATLRESARFAFGGSIEAAIRSPFTTALTSTNPPSTSTGPTAMLLQPHMCQRGLLGPTH